MAAGQDPGHRQRHGGSHLPLGTPGITCSKQSPFTLNSLNNNIQQSPMSAWREDKQTTPDTAPQHSRRAPTCQQKRRASAAQSLFLKLQQIEV